jgi:hypothetical protein
MTTVSIIGPSKIAHSHITINTYKNMLNNVYNILINELKLTDIILVSGGSSFSDHIAVSLYLEKIEFDKLILYLPCKWENLKFKDNGNTNCLTNPGKYLNYLHKVFFDYFRIDSLSDINLAIRNKAIIKDNYNGFHSRNREVAKSEYVIAFSYTDDVTEGGTLFTWKLAKGKKICLKI